MDIWLLNLSYLYNMKHWKFNLIALRNYQFYPIQG